MQAQYTDDVIARFWGRVDRSGDCWLWTWGVGTGGHGTVKINGHEWKTHRFAWTLTYGPIPPGTVIRHRCDVRRCVRPTHLRVGTQAENIADMNGRGRRRGATSPDRVRFEPSVLPIRRALPPLPLKRPICPHCGKRVPQSNRVHCGPACIAARRVAQAVARFWGKVDRSGPCWIWLGLKQPSGHGFLSWDGRVGPAHRFAWELAHGPIPDGLFVLHNCPGGDNPSCVRVEHLWLGTQADNLRDMRVKGRDAKGEAHGNARLSTDAVAQIRDRYAAGERVVLLAAEFGVSRGHINRLAYGQEWADAGGAAYPGNRRIRMTPEDVLEIRRRHAEGESLDALAVAFDATHRHIWRITTRRSWPDV